ncbi:MAG: hypothetical protein ACYS7Y_35725 [Planctomycetota bacterium]|jgi:hypothetical protein
MMNDKLTAAVLLNVPDAPDLVRDLLGHFKICDLTEGEVQRIVKVLAEYDRRFPHAVPLDATLKDRS